MPFGPAAVLTFATKLATFAVTALTAIVLARGLGAAGRGEYAILSLVPAAIVIVVNLGVGTVLTVTVGRDPALAGRGLSNALAFTAIASVAGWIIAAATLPLWSPAVEGVPLVAVALGVFAALPLLLYSLLIAILQGLRDFATTSKLTLLSYLLVFVLQVAVVLVLRGGLVGALVAFVVAHALVSAVALLALSRTVAPAPLDPPSLIRHLRAGAPNYLGALAWLVLARAPLVICAVVLTAADVGRLAVALTFVEVLLYAADSVVFALLPHAASAPVEEHYAPTPLAVRAVVGVAGLGALFLLAGADVIIPLLFGLEFAPAAVAVRWLLPGIVAAGLARVLTADLVARDRAWLSLGVLGVGAAIAVGSSPPLLIAASIAGAAAAWSLGQVTVAVGAVAAYAWTTHVPLIDLVIPRWSDVRQAAAFFFRRPVP